MKKIVILIALVLNLFAGVSEGDKALNFKLMTLDGKKIYKLSAFEGNVVLLNMWASWCGGCKKEMPEFFKLQKEYDKGFKIVTVSVDKDPVKSQKFLRSVEKELGYKTPFYTLYDPKKGLPKAYGAMGMPSSYLIDKEGIVRAVITGSLNSDDIEELKDKINDLR